MLGRYTHVFPIGLPRLRLCQGSLYWSTHKPIEALRAWRDGLTAAERLDMRYEQALAHYEVGRHLPTEDPQREDHLRRACELFEGCRASFYLSLTRQTLAAPAFA